MWRSNIAIRQQLPDKERKKKKKENKGGSSGKCLLGTTIQGLFFVIDLLGSRGILQHVFGLGTEDLAPPERHESEEEEDNPSNADKDNHNAVPHDEPGQIKDIRQDPNDGDETHVRKPATKLQIGSAERHGEWKGGRKRGVSSKEANERRKKETYVRAQQLRISLRCLWTLNQYGRIPNTNKKTARPNSITPHMTLTAYQTSPAAGVTRPWRGRLKKRER